jgi:hypothetical protein
MGQMQGLIQGQQPQAPQAPVQGGNPSNPWAGVPDDFIKKYEENKKNPNHPAATMSPEDAAKYYRDNYAAKNRKLGEPDVWKGIPSEARDKYFKNRSNKSIGAADTMTEAQAADYYRKNRARYEPTTGRGPQMGDPMYNRAFGEMYLDGRPLAKLTNEQFNRLQEEAAGDAAKLKESVEKARKQLGFDGAVINDDEVQFQNKRADSAAASADRSEKFLQDKKQNPGLKYQQPSTGFGTGEQASQAASDFNNMAAAEKAKKDAYNQKQDAVMDKSKSQMDEWSAATDAAYKEGKTLQQYIKDGVAAGTIKEDSYVAKHAAKIYGGSKHGSASDLAKLTAEYNVFQNANKPSDRMKFKDWVAQKNAKDKIDPKVLAQIEETYGPIEKGEGVGTTGYDTGKANTAAWKDSRQAAREEKKQGRKYGGRQAQAQGGLPPTAAGQPQSSAPDFDGAIARAGDDPDRKAIRSLKDSYKDATPEVQQAMGVLVSKATREQKLEALRVLKNAGIILGEFSQ